MGATVASPVVTSIVGTAERISGVGVVGLAVGLGLEWVGLLVVGLAEVGAVVVGSAVRISGIVGMAEVGAAEVGSEVTGADVVGDSVIISVLVGASEVGESEVGADVFDDGDSVTISGTTGLRVVGLCVGTLVGELVKQTSSYAHSTFTPTSVSQQVRIFSYSFSPSCSPSLIHFSFSSL